MNSKINLAIIKYGGLCSGGAEKFLQNIAINLPKDRFNIDYYYCDVVPCTGRDSKHPDTDQLRAKLLLNNNINLIKFNVAYRDVTKPTHDWIDTDFFDVFDEKKYDIIQTGRAGHPEFPFTKIVNTPIVDSIHLIGHIDRQENIKKVIHLSKTSANEWLKLGGDPNKIELMNLLLSINREKIQKYNHNVLKKELNIPEDCFVYGMHQRVDDDIFSEVPVEAYRNIETYNTYFVILGGSKKYSEQANRSKIKNFIQLDFSYNEEKIFSFLKMLDVYAHGRKDGKNNSQSIAEALLCELPIVTHVAPGVGHLEQIVNCGFMCKSYDEYIEKLLLLRCNYKLYNTMKQNCLKNFNENYSLENNMEKIIKIYENIIFEKNVDVMTDEQFWEFV